MPYPEIVEEKLKASRKATDFDPSETDPEWASLNQDWMDKGKDFMNEKEYVRNTRKEMWNIGKKNIRGRFADDLNLTLDSEGKRQLIDPKTNQPYASGLMQSSTIDSLHTAGGSSSITPIQEAGYGSSCNSFTCEIARKAGVKSINDFSYRDPITGSNVNVKKGDPLKAVPSNEFFDTIAHNYGFKHVEAKGETNYHESQSSFFDKEIGSGRFAKEYAKRYSNLVDEVDEIEEGDIYRMGFHPRFKNLSWNSDDPITKENYEKLSEGNMYKKDWDFHSNVGHAMIMGNEQGGKRLAASNPGNIRRGITSSALGTDRGTHLRFVGETKKKKEAYNISYNKLQESHEKRRLALRGNTRPVGNGLEINAPVLTKPIPSPTKSTKKGIFNKLLKRR